MHGRPDGDEAAAARRVGLEAQPREPGLDGGRVRRVRRQGPDLVRGPKLAEPRVARRARGEHGGLELVEVRVAQLEGHGVDLAAVDARGLAPVGQRAVAAGLPRRPVEEALRLGPPQARHAAALARGQQRRRQRRREHARREVPDGQAPAVAGEPRDDAEGCYGAKGPALPRPAPRLRPHAAEQARVLVREQVRRLVGHRAAIGGSPGVYGVTEFEVGGAECIMKLQWCLNRLELCGMAGASVRVCS